jgi:hypothetical protein
MFYSNISRFYEANSRSKPKQSGHTDSTKRVSDPPDLKEKTAGRAPTLLSGNFDSCAAILSTYDIADSRASAKPQAGAE